MTKDTFIYFSIIQYVILKSAYLWSTNLLASLIIPYSYFLSF